MKKISILLIFVLLDVGLSAQRRKAGTVEISYVYFENGKQQSDNGVRKLLATDSITKAWTDKSGLNLIPIAPKEAEYTNFLNSMAYQNAELKDGTKIYSEAKFSDLPKVTVVDDTVKILNYPCKKATCEIRSNKIEIWFTTEMGFKGSPQMGYGLTDGMVLRIVRNGNFEIRADKIQFYRDAQSLLPINLGTKLESPAYRSKISTSYITSVSVFKDDQISWGNNTPNPKGEVLDSVYHFSGGTIIMKKIKLPSVTSDYQVFAELTQYSNGDAYDRTGSIFIVPTDKEKSLLTAMMANDVKAIPPFMDKTGKSYYGMLSTPGFSPIIELIRFFTPFGIREFNEKSKVEGQTWENQSYYKEELTELLPKLQGEVWIGAFIGNYDKGGHKVSLDLKYYPGSESIVAEAAKKTWIYSAFSTINVMEMSGQGYGAFFGTDTLNVEVNIPKGLKNISLRYISTGHGGWENGDEFNKKLNEIFVDGNEVFSYIPWRTDCGTFRKYNPASGNFWNGTSSSDYSRSGWCPGSSSEPIYIPLKNLSEGKHTISVVIPLGQPEGGSFSAWNISGVLIGEYE